MSPARFNNSLLAAGRASWTSVYAFLDFSRLPPSLDFHTSLDVSTTSSNANSDPQPPVASILPKSWRRRAQIYIGSHADSRPFSITWPCSHSLPRPKAANCCRQLPWLSRFHCLEWTVAAMAQISLARSGRQPLLLLISNMDAEWFHPVRRWRDPHLPAPSRVTLPLHCFVRQLSGLLFVSVPLTSFPTRSYPPARPDPSSAISPCNSVQYEISCPPTWELKTPQWSSACPTRTSATRTAWRSLATSKS